MSMAPRYKRPPEHVKQFARKNGATPLPAAPLIVRGRVRIVGRSAEALVKGTAAGAHEDKVSDLVQPDTYDDDVAA